MMLDYHGEERIDIPGHEEDVADGEYGYGEGTSVEKHVGEAT